MRVDLVCASYVLLCTAGLPTLCAEDPDRDVSKPIPRFAFRNDNGQYGFLAADGTVVIPATYPHAIDFQDGLGRVSIGNDMVYLNEQGEKAFTLPEEADSTMRASEGRVWFQVKAKWGLCDRKGKILVPPTYDDVWPFKNGLARVNLGAELEFPGFMDGGKWGYIDRSGKVVLPIQYEYADDFQESVAEVADERGERFIDRQGNEVLRLKGAGEFSQGLCPVHIDRSLKGNDWLTRYVNKTGEVVLEIDGYGREFHDDLAIFSRRGELRDPENRFSYDSMYGFIDRQGKVVIAAKFFGAKPFQEGLAAVCVRQADDGSDASWGFIDKTGRLKIWPRFNEVESFYGGAAKAHVGGEYVVPEDASGWWEGGEWILINRDGKRLARLFATPGE